MDAPLALLLRIRGRVQGVGYRDWAVREAQALGLTGWVRNRTDGSVEALAQGDEAAVRAFAERCKTGPRFAAVSDVEQAPGDVDPALAGFARYPTA